MVLNQDVSLTGKRSAIAAGFMDGYVPYRDQKKKQESVSDKNSASFTSDKSCLSEEVMNNLSDTEKKSLNTMFH
jgi:hypothetical protein